MKCQFNQLKQTRNLKKLFISPNGSCRYRYSAVKIMTSLAHMPRVNAWFCGKEHGTFDGITGTALIIYLVLLGSGLSGGSTPIKVSASQGGRYREMER
jgi:hypothetical protein